jgi:selenocysteine-specific elongation factor
VGARSVVIGTAGHIDHGKTSLVRALTGVETDRLPEERRRGITIELGFAAWTPTPDIDASIVDVPGHEGLVHTMVAGAGGLDVVVLVVSAEDGVMPQTREHLNVCRLLGVKQGVVALNKIDRLEDDADAIELAVDDTRDVLAGTVFESAPIIPCSAVTGEGVDALRDTLIKQIRSTPGRGRSGRPRLCVDRCFSMRGHGTVVTGTLLSGVIDLDKDASLLALRVGRDSRSVRVRGMQVRGESVRRARAGTRLALNLGGVEVADISRGDVLTQPGGAISSDVFHARVEHLPFASSPWTHRASLRVCLGTATAIGRLDPLARGMEQDDALVASSDCTIAPSQHGLLRIRLDRALPMWWGQRVVLRAFSDEASNRHGLTVGGGRVVDPRPSSGRGQRERWVSVGEALASPDARARVEALIHDVGSRGVDMTALSARAGVDDPRAAIAPGLGTRFHELGRDRVVNTDEFPALERAIEREVDRFHAKHPMHPGAARADVLGRLPGRVAEDVAAAALARCLARGSLRVADDRGALARPGKGRLDPDALPEPMAEVLAVYRERGITPPTIKDLQIVTTRAKAELLEFVGLLQRSKLIIRVTPELSFDVAAHDELVDKVRSHLGEHGEIDVQGLKAIVPLSRKFAVPFLEHLDRLGVTRREGDRRVAGPRA